MNRTALLLVLTFSSAVLATAQTAQAVAQTTATQSTPTASEQLREHWSKLWNTPDQRATKMLQSGDAHQAANTFTDPRHKAYAELQAGDYAAANRDFAKFSDSDAHYNRGNALAHAGELAEAIRAYDAALASNPKNQDARHNRDLVAQALRQQPPKNQDQKSGKDKDKQAGQGQDKSSQQDKSGSDKNQQGADNKSTDKGSDNKSAENKDSGNKDAGKSDASSQAKDQAKDAAEKNKQDKQGTDQPQASGQQKQTKQADQADQADQAKQQAGQKQPPANDDKAQAQRDAAQSLANKSGEQTPPPANASASDHSAPQDQQNGKPTKATSAERAKKQTQDQWLRMIPDDPGGLLRRKLLIEHMMRQQKEQP